MGERKRSFPIFLFDSILLFSNLANILLKMSKQRRSHLKPLLLSTGLAVLLSQTGTAKPYLPSSESEVLEVLPNNFSKRRDDLTRLRKRLAKDPENPALAALVANKFIGMGAGSGDPRYYGYAHAAILKWWQEDHPPESVLKIRAKLLERDHLYEEALKDLLKVTEKNPTDAQTWLEIGNIYRVLGRYDKAREACEQMASFADEVPVLLCSAPVDALTGRGEEAYRSLARILPKARRNYPSTVQFIRTVQIEIARSLGLNRDAENLYKEGLQANPSNLYLLRGYGDLLLDQDRPNEALALLKDHTSDTGILLRAAIAAQESGATKSAKKWHDQLEARFREIRQRGGQPHGRFEARFTLELQNDPEGALTIALEHWKKQKEIRDTRTVLEAALAANKPEAAAPALKFLEENGNTHVILMDLRDQLNNK